MRILIVEDNQQLARQIKNSLEQELFIVDVADDGENGNRAKRADYSTDQ